MKALLHQAQAAPGLSLDPDVLDGDIYALCTPAGVVDLKTGDLGKPDPVTDMHSRATTLAPQKMPIPRWDSFLRDTFGDDEKGQETTRFLHTCSATRSPATSARRSCPSCTAPVPMASPYSWTS